MRGTGNEGCGRKRALRGLDFLKIPSSKSAKRALFEMLKVSGVTRDQVAKTSDVH